MMEKQRRWLSEFGRWLQRRECGQMTPGQLEWLRWAELEQDRERREMAADLEAMRRQRRLIVQSLALIAVLLVASVVVLYWGA